MPLEFKNGKVEIVPKKGSAPVISKPHAELDTLRLASGLTVGQQYSTVIETKHIQPITGKLKVGRYDFDTLTPEQLAEVQEEIILTANSTSTFESIAVSMKYPGETMDYDFTNTDVTYDLSVSDGQYPISNKRGDIASYNGTYYVSVTQSAQGEDILNTLFWKPVFTSADLMRKGWINARHSSVQELDVDGDYREIRLARFKPAYTFNGTPIEEYISAKQEYTKFDFTGVATPQDLNGKYILYSSTTADYYMWFNNTDSPVVDPAIPTRTGVQVDINNATDWYTFYIIVVNTYQAEFLYDTDLVTHFYIRCAEPGAVLNSATAGDSGATITIQVVGAAETIAELQAETLYSVFYGSSEAKDIYKCIKTTTTKDFEDRTLLTPIYYGAESNTGASGYAFPDDIDYSGFIGGSLEADLTDYQEFPLFTISGAKNAILKSPRFETMNLVVKGTVVNAKIFDAFQSTTGQLVNMSAYYFERSQCASVNYGDFTAGGLYDSYCPGAMSNFQIADTYDVYFGSTSSYLTSLALLESHYVTGIFTKCFYKGRCYNNKLYFNCKYNEHESEFNDNTFRAGIEGCNTGYTFSNNDFEQPFKRIRTTTDWGSNIGLGTSQMSDCSFGSDCQSNTFYNFRNNIVGDSFQGNTCNGVNQNNTYSYQVQGNVFKTGFERNKVESSTSSCTFNEGITYTIFAPDTVSETFEAGLYQATAIGDGAKARKDNAVAVGTFADATGNSASALGSYSNAYGNRSVAISTSIIDDRRIGAGKVQIGKEDSQNLQGFDVDGANGKLTITRAGVYDIQVDTSFLGSGNSTVHAHIFKNGTECVNIGFKRRLGATGDIGSASMSGRLTLAVGDYLEVKLTGSLSGGCISVEYLNFNINRLK